MRVAGRNRGGCEAAPHVESYWYHDPTQVTTWVTTRHTFQMSKHHSNGRTVVKRVVQINVFWLSACLGGAKGGKLQWPAMMEMNAMLPR